MSWISLSIKGASHAEEKSDLIKSSFSRNYTPRFGGVFVGGSCFPVAYKKTAQVDKPCAAITRIQAKGQTLDTDSFIFLI
jgi:hypothetical protein